jgi:spore germination protein GerM
MLKHPDKRNVNPLALVLVMGLLFSIASTGLTGCKKKHHHHRHHHASPTVQNTENMTLFFSKKQGAQSVTEAVVRKLPSPPPASSERLKVVLTELLKGPTVEEKANGLYTEIPDGTQLLGLIVEKNNLTVNLSSHFSTGGGSNSMIRRFEEIRQTIFSIDRQHTVSMAVEGKILSTLGGEGLEVDDALKRQVH